LALKRHHLRQPFAISFKLGMSGVVTPQLETPFRDEARAADEGSEQ
jgi:hypothetical protein